MIMDLPTLSLLGLLCLFLAVFVPWLTTRYIPNNRIGIVEKLWSARGSLVEGAVIALKGEAGFQANIIRGGLHFGLWRWQYRVHKLPLVTIKQGRIGYVFSRGGDQLMPSQTLARIVECNNFQDARKFLSSGGQKGRQRQGRRVLTACSGKDLQHVFIVPTARAAFHSDAIFLRMLLQ